MQISNVFRHTYQTLSGSSGSLPRTLPVLLILLLCLAGCGSPGGEYPAADPDNAGLVLPGGFEAFVVADSVGRARHIVVNENGDIYVKLRRSDGKGGLVALRDTDGDGRADVIRQFGSYGPDGNFETDIKIRDGYLYFSTDLHVYRYPLTPGELLPDTTRMDTLVIDDHEHGYHQHITKPIAFDDRGGMFVPFGVPTDACQDPPRTPGLAGQDPCPDLELHGGIWRFEEGEMNQVQQESRRDLGWTQPTGIRFASGLRSILAMEWHPADRQLYAIQHGRDYLFRQWPEYYSRWDSAMLPAEEFVRVTEGSNFGWPFCYYDQLQEKRVLGPEYGGNGNIVGRCSEMDDPVIGFPGHFAPHDMKFYLADQFPEHYRNGAFIAWHGSTIRNPYPQAGYFVAFVPWKQEENGFTNEWEVFANGFAEVDPIVSTSDARHRPSGLAIGPDGSLYIVESNRGKIWRIIYTGDRASFGEEQLAPVREEKRSASNIRTPHPEKDNLEREVELGGESIYNIYCAACHSRNGEGSPPRFPPLAGTDWVTGSKERLIDIVLQGLDGPIIVRGESYNNPMPAHDFLSDEEISQILTYIRQNFGNEADAVSREEVRAMRERMGL